MSSRRWVHRGAFTLLLTGTALAAGTSSAWADGPCNNWWEVVASPVLCAGANSAYDSAKQGVLDDITNAIVDGVDWVSGAIGDAMRSSGTPDLHQAWFSSTFEATRTIGAMFALVALLCSAIYAGLTRDGREVGRTLASVLTAGLSTGMIGAIVLMFNAFMDYVCDVMLGTDGWAAITDSLKAVADLMNKAAKHSDDPSVLQLPAIVTILLGLLMILALGIAWCEMVIRRLAIDVCVLFWPITVSGSIWKGARRATGRLRDTLITVELAKPVIVILFKAAANDLKSVNSASGLLVAAGLYILAAFGPYLVMGMVGIVGGGLEPGGTTGGMRAAGIGGVAGMAAGIAGIAGAFKGMEGVKGGSSNKSPSAAGQAAAMAGPTGQGFQAGMTALQSAARPMLQAGRNMAGGNPELQGGNGGGGGGVLEGRVIPGQLSGTPARNALPSGGNRLALPPGNSGSGNGPGRGGGAGTGPGAGGNKYSPPAPPRPNPQVQSLPRPNNGRS